MKKFNFKMNFFKKQISQTAKYYFFLNLIKRKIQPQKKILVNVEAKK